MVVRATLACLYYTLFMSAAHLVVETPGNCVLSLRRSLAMIA